MRQKHNWLTCNPNDSMMQGYKNKQFYTRTIPYLIFVNDATDNINREIISPSQFADDLGIWSSGKSVLTTMKAIQDGVHVLEAWCKRWFVALNPIKSQLVVFTKCPTHKKQIIDHKPILRLFGEDVNIIAEATYLGVIFDARLTWEPQFRKMTTKAYKILNLLRHLSSLSNTSNPNTMIHLYRSMYDQCCRSTPG